MIVPTPIATILVLFSVAFARPTKRQATSVSVSGAAAAALTLNQALAYQICIIASGSVQAVQAISGNIFTTPVCVAPIITKPTTNVYTILRVTGCATTSTSNGDLTECRDGGYIGTGGYTYLGPISTMVPSFFSIPSSNSNCSGVVNPFTLESVANQPFKDNFGSNSWNVDCTTGALTLSDSGLHFCLANYQLYSTVDSTCSSNFTFNAIAFSPPNM